MIGSEDLSVSGIDADSKDGAFNDAMKDLRKGMVGFVDKHFKFETYILGRYGDGRCQTDPFQGVPGA